MTKESISVRGRKGLGCLPADTVEAILEYLAAPEAERRGRLNQTQDSELNSRRLSVSSRPTEMQLRDLESTEPASLRWTLLMCLAGVTIASSGAISILYFAVFEY